MIEVLQPGLLTTIQDSGRKGYEAYGIPRSGFFDPFLAGIANRLVGNAIDAPLLEFALIGPSLSFAGECVIGICGFGLNYQLDQEAFSEFQAVSVRAGSALRFVSMKGWFGYIAVSGGIRSEKMLGSVSTHFSGGIGKRLEKGQKIEVSGHFQEANELSGGASLSAMREEFWAFPKETLLHLLPAHHTGDFHSTELQKITDHSYRISPQSNRMGIRLDGTGIDAPLLRRSVPALTGAVQVPGSGLPIILGPEGPTTGGYAQIGILSRTSWTVLAGRKPGETVQFDWIDRQKARQSWENRQKILTTAEAWKRM